MELNQLPAPVARSNGPAHIVFISTMQWSHVIANMQTALRVLSLSPTSYLTFLSGGENLDMTRTNSMFNNRGAFRLKHILESYTGLPKTVRDRIQVLEIYPGAGIDPTSDSEHPWDPPEEVKQGIFSLDGFEGAWLDLCGDNLGSGIGSIFKLKPTVYFYDSNDMYVRYSVSSLSKTHGTPELPGFVVSGMASTRWLYFFAPEEMFGGIAGAGGLRDRYNKFREQGMEEGPATAKAVVNGCGRLMHFPDLPPMYDYEFIPQSGATKWGELYVRALELIGDIDKTVKDGLIDFGVPEFEPYATEELGKMLAKRGKKHFPIGYPLTREIFEAQKFPTRAQRGNLNELEKKILDWLDKMEKTHGARSVAYVCFGSMVWPTERPELIERVIDGLLDAKPPIPFLWSMSSGKPVDIPSETKAKAIRSGIALFVDWVPQMAVLQHEAVRFFISHCGAGSMIETVLAGVPVVAVPFVNDEAFIARQLVQHKAAIQLHQLNSGMKDKPLGIGGVVTEHTADILAEMRKTYATLRDERQYEEYRRNVRTLSDMLEGSANRGRSRNALEDLIDTYL